MKKYNFFECTIVWKDSNEEETNAIISTLSPEMVGEEDDEQIVFYAENYEELFDLMYVNNDIADFYIKTIDCAYEAL